MSVCVCTSQFEVSDDADSMQMLQRSTQVGEYYRMAAPPVGWLDGEGAKHRNYMDIILYDEEQDRHVHISFEEAIKAAGITDLTTDSMWDAVDDKTGKIQKGTLLSWQDAIDFNKAGKWRPMELIIARPFIEHLMMSAVMTVAGRDTGATLFGPADMCAEPTCKRFQRGADPGSPLLASACLCSQANLRQHLGQDD